MLCAAGVRAQEVADSTEAAVDKHFHSLMIGGGSGNVLASYLSPFNYTGGNVQFIRETKRGISRFFIGHKPVRFQTLLDLNYSFLTNPAGNVNEHDVGLNYSVSWQYYLVNKGERLDDAVNPSFNILAGPMLTYSTDGVYNERNTNNPGDVQTNLSLDATFTIEKTFRLWHRQWAFHYQMIIPMIGFGYFPEYGQSYYEMFILDDTDDIVSVTNIFNSPSIRNLLTLDVPLSKHYKNTRLRLGYSGNLMQSKINNLRYHKYTHSFLIGVTKVF